jgi:hypothetical protein
LIAKISKGSSGRGLVRYLFGPGKANEHTDQRVVADLDDDDPNFQLDEFDRNQGGIDFER